MIAIDDLARTDQVALEFVGDERCRTMRLYDETRFSEKPEAQLE